MLQTIKILFAYLVFILLTFVFSYLVFLSSIDLDGELLYICVYNVDITDIDLPMSGVRCSTCAANGQESWVIPGKTCGYCGTGC